ncbi:MAG TPA: hypothetical protein EYP41_18585, partial [Anaerolineae bacterium]|nr:hypothetical protein [Anaerolineae bacterium]
YYPHLSHGRSRAAVSGVLWSSLHTLIPTISSAAVFFIGAYFLSPSDFGLVGFASALVSIAIAFSPLAFGEALVQQTVMDMIREAQNAGTTVFFSSHNLPEVQAVCDRVGIIREGRLVATERIEDLMKQQLKRLRLSFSSMPPAAAFGQEGVTEIERDGQTVLLEVRDNLNAVLETAVTYHVTDIETESVSLEEVFLAYYGKGNGGNHA